MSLVINKMTEVKKSILIIISFFDQSMAKKLGRKFKRKKVFAKHKTPASLLKRILYDIIGFPSALALIDSEITTEIGIAMQSVPVCPFLSLS